MSEQTQQEKSFDEKFIDHLEKYVERDDREALAHLRRGLGKEPGLAMEMSPYVMPWIKKFYDEKSYFLIASLIGLYPTKSWNKHKEYNNLGKSLSTIDDPSESMEKRFVALLNSPEEDLPEHLRQIVSLLKSKEIPINWLLLLKHIKSWSYDSKYVQKSWAKGFWGSPDLNKDKGENK